MSISGNIYILLVIGNVHFRGVLCLTGARECSFPGHLYLIDDRKCPFLGCYVSDEY